MWLTGYGYKLRAAGFWLRAAGFWVRARGAASSSVYGPFGIDELDGALPPSAELRVTAPLSGRSVPSFSTVLRERNRSGPREG